MWRTQLRLGLVPYYMFVERDTGPQGFPLRRPAGARRRDLPGRLQQRVGPVPNRARAVHVGHARQGLR